MEYYFISAFGEIEKSTIESCRRELKRAGNCFKTYEEALKIKQAICLTIKNLRNEEEGD